MVISTKKEIKIAHTLVTGKNLDARASNILLVFFLWKDNISISEFLKKFYDQVCKLAVFKSSVAYNK